MKKKLTPDNIQELTENQIFVFGSNMNGNHAGGAARLAVEKFGAVMGQAEGIQGQSYAIPTLDKDMQKVTEEELITYLGNFREFAEEHPEKEFLLTAIGTGIAGFDTNYMAYMILRANLPDNVTLPKEFTKIKGYKGFNPDMTCRGFKYEEGKDYEEEGEIGACENGFHFCLHPLDVFGYYPPAYIGMNKFHEVEGSGYMDADEDDTKIACSKIHIGAKLDIKGLVKATVSYVKERCTNRNNANPGFPATAGNYGAATAGDSGAATAGNSGAATAGNYGAATAGCKGAATAGNYGAATAGYKGAATAGNSGAATAGDSGAATAGDRGAATAGDYGAATAGYRGAATAGDSGAATAGNSGAATAGNYGAATAGYKGAATAGNSGAATAGDSGAATAGDRGAATAGDYGAATAGYRGAATAGDSGAATAGDSGAATAGNSGAATAGDYGAATSRGSSSTGNNGLAVARGTNVKIRGGMGSILVIAEEQESSYDVSDWKAVVVDGKNIKADTWYRLVGGEVVEVED